MKNGKDRVGKREKNRGKSEKANGEVEQYSLLMTRLDGRRTMIVDLSAPICFRYGFHLHSAVANTIVFADLLSPLQCRARVDLIGDEMHGKRSLQDEESGHYCIGMGSPSSLPFHS